MRAAASAAERCGMMRPFGSRAALLAPFVLAALAVGCSGGGSSGGGTPATAPTVNPALHYPHHVVVIVMENRSVDNLFQFLPGADTASSGPNSHGGTTALTPVSLLAPYDPDHSHITGYLTEYANGKQNGFDLEQSTCSAPPGTPSYGCSENVYAYVPQQEVQPYYQLAESYAFANHVLQTNAGPSYPAHEYLVAGQSGRPLAVAENPRPNVDGGCGNKTPDEAVALIDLSLPFPSNEDTSIFPCVDFPTIFDVLDAHKLSWKYYMPRKGTLWNALNQIKHLYASASAQANASLPETNILTDVKNGTLPDVSYVVPHSFWSDHANSTCTNLPMGPDFVGAIVDAIGESKYWNDTAIFVTWDDWGGWYDHIAPRTPLQLPNDPYEYGFRVPLIAVSPYARNHTVDGTYRDFTAILRFIERVNGLPAIASDSMEQRTDDLTSMFRFGNQTPAPFQPIATAHSPAYWAALPSPLPACIAPTPFPTPSGALPSGAAPPAEEF